MNKMHNANKYVDSYNEIEQLEYKLADAKSKQSYYFKLVKNNVLYSGIKETHNGEYWTNWWVFDGCLTDEQVYKNMVELGISANLDRGVWDNNDWDCSGLALVRHPSIRRTNTRILVTQDGFIDC
tara:strand:- start:86 stop:460 length:375 start_codon:yes stop_codon:yes gene_type:complete